MSKQSSVRILTHKIQNVEWVFQFNDDEPIFFAEPSLFGYSTELSFTIGNTTDSIITFNDNKGNSFKLFAREKQNTQMSNNKQSSVELLIEQLEEKGELRDCTSLGLIQLNIDKNDYLALKEKAKAMHKEEIERAHYEGSVIVISKPDDDMLRLSQQYYNETFGE